MTYDKYTAEQNGIISHVSRYTGSDLLKPIEMAKAKAWPDESWQDFLGEAWLLANDPDLTGGRTVKNFCGDDVPNEEAPIDPSMVSPSCEDLAKVHQMEEHVRLCVDALDPVFREVLIRHYGIQGQPETFREIGYDLNLTGAKVSWKHEKAIRRIRVRSWIHLLRVHLDERLSQHQYDTSNSGLEIMADLRERAASAVQAEPTRAPVNVVPPLGAPLSDIIGYILASIPPGGFALVGDLHHEQRGNAITELERQGRVMRIVGASAMVLRLDDRVPHRAPHMPKDQVLNTLLNRTNAGLERLMAGRPPTWKQLKRMMDADVVEIIGEDIIVTDAGRDRIKMLEFAKARITAIYGDNQHASEA